MMEHHRPPCHSHSAAAVSLALLKTLRPSQWFKNVSVAVPLVFAQKALDPDSSLRTLAAVALFSLISSCVYVLNDLVDLDADRAHPYKRNRPLASGRLPISVARMFVVLTVPTVLGLSFWLAPRFAAAVATYFVLNVAYSLKLKRIPFLDVLLIAGFFLLRVLAGALAIDVPVSPWLLVCTFLLATFLAVGKRVHELTTVGEEGTTRAVLKRYDLGTLRWSLHILAVVTVVVYVLYTRSDHTVNMFGTDALVYTVPFPIIGILRFIHLVTSRHEAESPTQEMLTDPIFMLNLALYGVVCAGILYGRIM